MEPQMPSSSLDNAVHNGTVPFVDTPAVSSTTPVNQQNPFATQSNSSSLPIKMEPEHVAPVETNSSRPRKKWFSYPLIGLITIIAGVVLAAQQYGLGNLIPYPLSGLIAAWLIILVGLWLLAKGRLGRLLSFWLGLVVVVVVGGMIYDTLYPGTLPRTGSWGITVGYEKEWNNLTLRLGTLPFSGSDEVIIPSTPVDETSIDTLIDSATSSSGEGNNLSGYTITITGSDNTTGTKK